MELTPYSIAVAFGHPVCNIQDLDFELPGFLFFLHGLSFLRHFQNTHDFVNCKRNGPDIQQNRSQGSTSPPRKITPV